MCDRFAPASGLQNGIFSYQNIYRCYLACRKNKRNSFNALKFEINAGENISKLERVVHHILVKEFEKIWEPVFIHDSYACREGKGTHKAVTRLRSFLRRITRNGHIRAYYLQLDIKDFFTSIDKELLFTIIQRKVSNPQILWLARVILFWDCTRSFVKRGNPQLLFNIPINKSLFNKDNKRGLPIGNLTSQFFANIYLNELDQFVKHELKVKYYLRYADDFVLLSQDKEELLRWKQEIKEFLVLRLKLQLHPRRQKLQLVSNGIDFLGYIIRPGYILVRRRVVNNLKAKIRELRNCSDKLRDSIASYLGHLKWANSYQLTQKIFKGLQWLG